MTHITFAPGNSPNWKDERRLAFAQALDRRLEIMRRDGNIPFIRNIRSGSGYAPFVEGALPDDNSQLCDMIGFKGVAIRKITHLSEEQIQYLWNEAIEVYHNTMELGYSIAP
jgi:hypothetical protein